jgi:hypothetical protein
VADEEAGMTWAGGEAVWASDPERAERLKTDLEHWQNKSEEDLLALGRSMAVKWIAYLEAELAKLSSETHERLP